MDKQINLSATDGCDRWMSREGILTYYKEHKGELNQYNHHSLEQPVTCVASVRGWVTYVTESEAIGQCWAGELTLNNT